MLNNFFFTLVFFILDHLVLLLASGLISAMAMKYFYRIWQDHLRPQGMRHISLIILLLLAIMLLIFIAGLLYIITIIILFLPELLKLMGK
jgi:hypothetical protein